ncbi:hypothetical protein LSTR_LSTR000056 [Laodelphax striatellus]|uniref:Uncharacterized protein n=1 Tax=Laodelphax striatellus TaxID=195883 RepID=A0A482X6N7_LAOST|nr:hypothetical protein LSTR_LSTR000056 [Laodelphax striatellus]
MPITDLHLIVGIGEVKIGGGREDGCGRADSSPEGATENGAAGSGGDDENPPGPSAAVRVMVAIIHPDTMTDTCIDILHMKV